MTFQNSFRYTYNMLAFVMLEKLQRCAPTTYSLQLAFTEQRSKMFTYVFMTSACVIAVFCAISSILNSSEELTRRSTIVSAQYALYDKSPRSLNGFSGLPSFPSFLLSSYE